MKISMRAPHALDLPTLRARVEQRIAHYTAKYPKVDLASHYRWIDERNARAEYRGGAAKIQLGDREIGVELSLPFIAFPYRGRIEDFVKRELADVTQPTEQPTTST